MKNKITIGKKIKAKRLELGLTQKQFADILDVSDKTISRWELEDGYPASHNSKNIKYQS